MKGIIRNEIKSVIDEHNFSSEEVNEVGIYKWRNIIEQFEQNFIKLPHHSSQIRWYWEYLKDGYSVDFESYNAYKYLHKLINNQEKVYFMVEDLGERNKFWIYESYIKVIQKVLEETQSYEYYIVSKKYKWFLCENHHGFLIGAGNEIIEKLKNLKLL
jgi:hypothetical protein